MSQLEAIYMANLLQNELAEGLILDDKDWVKWDCLLLTCLSHNKETIHNS